MSKKPRMYIETTIPSYLAARPSRDVVVLAHQQITREWWHGSEERYEMFVSSVVLDEIRSGDETMSRMRLDLIRRLPRLEITDEIGRLAERYIKELRLPGKAYRDALHIGLAVGHGMDILLTWNCAHIANERIRRKLQKVNLEIGCDTPSICTPEELVPHETE